jgi:hypothetical protein
VPARRVEPLRRGPASPRRSALLAVGGLSSAPPATGSVLERLSRLERRSDALGDVGAKAEVSRAKGWVEGWREGWQAGLGEEGMEGERC